MILAISFFLGGYGFFGKLYAQENKPISVALIPKIGCNFSYYHLTQKSARKNFRYTTGLVASRDFYWGLGLQLSLWHQLKATLTLSQTFVGGGPEYQNLYKEHFANDYKDILSFPVDLFTLNFSRKVWCFHMRHFKGKDFSSEFDVLFGAGVLWITKNNRVKQSDMTGWGSMNYQHTWNFDNATTRTFIPKNYYSGIINVGLTYQLKINKKGRLLLGIRYSYGLDATWLVKYKSDYYYDDIVKNIYDHSSEDFNAETGRHQFVVFMGYPINLYRNKAQKEYLKGASISGK